MGSVQRRRDGKTEKLPDMSGILQSLRGLAVPIEQLETDPENANVHSEASIEAIARSLNRFGQRKPIVVHKKTMTVKAGNGMFEAARSLGWSHIAAVVVDEEDLEAAAFALADNKTAELSTWDVSKLKEQLASFDEADYGGMSDLGWNPDELAKLLEGAPAPALKLKPGKGAPPPPVTGGEAPKGGATLSPAPTPASPEQPPEGGYTRMFHLYLTDKNFEAFRTAVGQLVEAGDYKNPTDAIVAVVYDAVSRLEEDEG